MRIGIIGVGNVGSALGTGWVRAGHEVMFGVRNPDDEKVQRLLSLLGTKAQAAPVADAAKFGEVIVLATPWPAAKDAISQIGDLSGKILFDCTNPLKPSLDGLELGLDSSGGEQVAEWAKGAKVVKIFNTTGADNMAKPHYGETKLTMLYCGDDASAKETAAKLAADLGFDPVDVGPLKQSRLLEPLAMLWISLAFGGLGRDFAFNLIRR
ncbi:MAG TPA: NADPH-dependent F420 reductase [Blastocatellia bacterium]|nr:NADPH-dependent F420 reductase [Blastocatellia bacterium]